MSRFILSYISKLEHLRKGLLSTTEYVVFDVLLHAAGWNDARPDYARVERNVSKFHREFFLDEETGFEALSRPGVHKQIQSLLRKGYITVDGVWWFIPNYPKYQTMARKGSGSKTATPVAKSLVDNAQHIATSVKPPVTTVTPAVTVVTEIATQVTPTVTQVTHEGPEIQSPSGSVSPSTNIQPTTSSPTTPLPPEGEEGAAEEEKLRNRFEAFFSRELQVIQLAPADYRHIRTLVTRRIPFQMVQEVVEDVKRAFKPKGPGDRIRGVGLFMLELEARLAAPPALVPTGVEDVATAPRSRFSQAYERARQGYYESRFARENPKATAPGIQVQKLFQKGAWDAEFQQLIRVEAGEMARRLAVNPHLKRLYEQDYPRAALIGELDQEVSA